MKLLLDQNLSRKLVRQLAEHFPDSVHISTVLSEETTDRDIWEYAKENSFTTVSKDDDFEKRSVLFGHPPKIVWIRLGNCKTSEITDLLIKSKQILLNFDADEEKSYLSLP